MSSAPIEAETTPYRWIILFGVWLLYFSFGVIAASMAPLVRPVIVALDLDNARMGVVLGAWPLVYVAAAIPCGAFLDKLGPRKALLFGVAIIAASGAARGLATSEFKLILAVAIFGLGGPVISIGAPKLVSLWFAERERGMAMGIYITGSNLGAVAALSLTNGVMMPLLGQDWRLVLFCYAGFALAAGAVWFAISAHPASRAMERRLAKEPQRPQIEQFVSLMRLPVVRIVLVMSVGIFFFNHGLNNWLPEILRTNGMAPAQAGYWASIPTGVGIVGALLIPRLAAEPRRLKILLALFMGAGVATLLLRAEAGPLLAAGLALQGIARGAMMAVAVLVLMESSGVESGNVGLAGGMFFSAAEIGGVLGPLTIGFVAEATGGFSTPLALLTVVAGALILLLFWLRMALRDTKMRAASP
ncbi:MAG: MFS transporter [Rhodospirillaceae bacterium]|jgi:MFS transporter, CP family, cyanate transporter|nr:MFS transporter [Rhodospirillaceae bacterium]MBT5666808.1 MFS transporter [Rhodospirillaceae bacterium]MBT5811813.1 MFS transporter [Rhodospirillaceae bacterium]